MAEMWKTFQNKNPLERMGLLAESTSSFVLLAVLWSMRQRSPGARASEWEDTVAGGLVAPYPHCHGALQPHGLHDGSQIVEHGHLHGVVAREGRAKTQAVPCETAYSVGDTRRGRDPQTQRLLGSRLLGVGSHAAGMPPDAGQTRFQVRAGRPPRACSARCSTVFVENAFKTMEDAPRFTKNSRLSRIRRWKESVTTGFFLRAGGAIRADVAVPEATELSRIVVSTVFETDTDGTTIPRLLAPRHATARHRNLSERETSLLGLPFYGHIVVLLVREHEHQSYLHGPLVG